VIPLADAQALVRLHAPLWPPEAVALREAVGRALAEDVATPLPFPIFDNSAMDGYAVGGPEGPWELKGELAAGDAADFALMPGEAARVSTGAVLPRGTYAVLAQEDARREGGVVSGVAKAGRHIRRQGEETAAGALVARTGDAVTPALVSALSAIGLVTAPVRSSPAVAVLCTGDELVVPGSALQPGQIYDSNRAGLQALMDFWKIPASCLHLGDDASETRETIGRLLADHDLLVTTGGVSVGEHDLVVEAMASAGMEIVFHGVAVKPGKPVAFGKRPDGKAWFGLPGNPMSTWVGVSLFVAPYLGRDFRTVERALATAVERAPGREEYVPFEFDARGRVQLRPVVGSHANFGLVGADGFARLPAGSGLVAAGEPVLAIVFPWSQLQ
jgi:molybdopterin molybdotransferase